MIFENKSIKQVIDCSINKNEHEKAKILENAYEIASKNLSKEKIQHTLNTAYILGEQHLDVETIAAALLHELTETQFRELKEEIIKKTNKETSEIIKEIINGNTIRDKNKDSIDLNLLGKIIFGATKDIRAIFVRLAGGLERIRNMKKLETKDELFLLEAIKAAYVPIAHKLGLYDLEWQLNDFCFKLENSSEYKKIKQLVKLKRSERENIVRKLKKELKKILEENEIHAIIEARTKSFSSIYKKMKEGHKFSEIDDLYGVRIITDTVTDCYKVLGIINEKFETTQHFHDFIARPKENNYQSIHTVIKYNGVKYEIQIRTQEMHINAELGSASHWKYKKFESEPLLDGKLSWAKQLVDWQKTIGKKDFIKSFKIDFGKNQVFVFTPKKEVIRLPENSTPVDFAFAIHTNLGLRCKKAIVNGKEVKLDYIIQNGDEIKIIAGEKNTVKENWLSFVKTTKAKNKIRQALGIKKMVEKKKASKIKKVEKIIAAECCKPLPGDKTIAYRTTKRKITIHRINCENIQKLDKKRMIRFEWVETKENYPVKIKIKAINKPGTLIELLNKISKENISLNKTETKSLGKNLVEGIFEIQVRTKNQLERIINEIENTDFVLKVERE